MADTNTSLQEGFERTLGQILGNEQDSPQIDVPVFGDQTPTASDETSAVAADENIFVPYDPGYSYESNGWVPVQGQGGEVAYIEPQKGHVAMAETYSHPVLNRNIDRETARKLAADTIKYNERRQRKEASKAREAAKNRGQVQTTPTQQTESTPIENSANVNNAPTSPSRPNLKSKFHAEEAANNETLAEVIASTPAAAAVDAAMSPAIIGNAQELVAPESNAAPRLAPKFHAEEGEASVGSSNESAQGTNIETDTNSLDQNEGKSKFRKKFSASEDGSVGGGTVVRGGWQGQAYQQTGSNRQQTGQQQSNQRQPGFNQQQTNQPTPTTPNPSIPRNAASQAVDNAMSERDLIEYLAKEKFYSDVKDAKRENKDIYNQQRNDWIKANPGRSTSEFEPDTSKYNPEAFADSLGSAMRENWGKPGEEPVAMPGREIKDQSSKWKLLDRVNYAFQIGFFHIQSEKIKYDKEGNPHTEYSLKVTRTMEEMEKTFGLGGAVGRRTIFRLVMMYASMSVDRHGKMFNEDAKEWSMSDDDFVRVCRLIMNSAYNNHGNPMVMPHKKEKLGGTEIYPAGVMPKSVAKILVNPNNKTLDGNIEVADLIQMCQDEWTRNTYPRMQARLAKGMKPPKRRKGKDTGERIKVGPFAAKVYKEDEYKENLEAQKIVVENFNEALSRLDGMKLEDFSSRYRVDTSLHYCLEEYKDSNKLYAKAANGNFDADIVMAREEVKVNAWDKRLKPNRYYTVKNADGSVVFGGVKHQTSLGAGARIFTKIVKANALFAQIPLMIGAISEHGIGNLQSNLTLHAMLGRRNSHKMSDAAHRQLHSKEFIQAMSAVKLLMELLGPGGCRLFAKENLPYTNEAVVKFARENYMPDSSSERMRDVETWISNAVDKVMTGDLGFKRSDNTNWWLGLMVANDRRLRKQNRLAANNKVDKFGIAFTPDELEDMLLHQDPGKFLAQMMGDDMGIDAYMLMRGNNVGNINLVIYNVDQALRRHGVFEGAITAFVDNFPKYGINLLMSMLPMSKTITYLIAKRPGNKNIATDTDLVIGGNIETLGGETGHWYEDEGLRMNLWYDAFMMGRQVLIMPFIVGAVMAMIGYEPPDNKRNLFNSSMWKVGGIELNQTYWVNDITLLTLPVACMWACILSGNNDKDLGQGDKNLALELFLDSLYGQIDGNVVLDCANIVKNWQIDIAEMKLMAEDPAYESEIITPSAGVLFAQEYALSVFNKVTPFAPLYRSAANSTIIRGRDANMIAYNKVFDRSDEWHRENNVTNYINDPFEISLRQNSAKNYLLAMILDVTRGPGLFGFGDQTKTGYLWWEMPTRTGGDPLDYLYTDMFKIDYDRREVNPETGELETYEEYENRMGKFLIDYIKANFDHPQEAVRDKHLVIPSKIKICALKYLQSENQFLRDEQSAREEAGDFINTDEMWKARFSVNAVIAENKQFIRDWLNNNEIPEWGESYDIRLTNWETTFYNTEDNSPASPWEYLIGKPGVEIALIEKGDHPNNFLPFTVVDDWGGFNKETVNYWRDENTDMEYIDSLLTDPETGEDRIIPLGRDKGKTFREVLYGGEQPPGMPEYTNRPDSTVGHRSWVPHERKVSEEVRDLAEKVLNDSGDNNNDDSKGSNKGKTYFPRSTYGGYKGSSRSSYSKSNYNPKIYSTKVYNTKLSSSRVYNNDRINIARADSTHANTTRVYNSRVNGTRIGNSHINNSRINDSRTNNTRISNTRSSSYRTSVSPRQVNNDRAANMGTRNPQDANTKTYLRPEFSTKGSREAYKRQDI